ncbi:MAG: MFS transporter [candidate division Zixibacteria bacterium SM23_81]|nr:MAG: MFS transporter [candidate division Zixibacteria bacterium SM23_81]
MIEVKGLTKYYGPKMAISQVTFRVQKGEILGLLGPNAAGKTTTIRILTCYMPATEGSARVAGFDVFEDSLEVRRRIGYLPENPPLYNDMTVTQYLDFVSKIKGVDGYDRKKKVQEITDLCHIEDVRDTLIGKLSKGYKQRVGLAQALVHDPEIIILDEPTIGLDPKQIIEVRELVKNLGGKHTVILSSHILPEVSQVCQRVVIINEGLVVAEDTPENLTSQLKGAERLFLDVEGPAQEVAQKIENLAGITQVTLEGSTRQGRSGFLVESELNRDVRKELAATIIRGGWGLLEMRPVGMSLEEIFLHLTTKEEEVDAR